jgi:phage terminase small subunit
VAQKPLKRLTPAHEDFLLRFIARPASATAAYIAAGFSPGGARQSASRLLQDPLVAKRYKQLIEEKHKALHMDVDEILARTAMYARVDAAVLYDEQGNLRPIHLLSETESVGIAGIEVVETFSGTGKDRVKTGEIKKVRLRDPMPALRLLAEHKKLVKSNDEGVNALASALADRLKAARERRRSKDKPK